VQQEAMEDVLDGRPRSQAGQRQRHEQQTMRARREDEQQRRHAQDGQAVDRKIRAIRELAVFKREECQQ
jgi:hypothetical protein